MTIDLNPFLILLTVYFALGTAGMLVQELAPRVRSWRRRRQWRDRDGR